MWWWLGVALAGPVWVGIDGPVVADPPLTGIVIDGDLSDWDPVNLRFFADGADLSGVYAVSQDDEALYVMAQVQDDVSRREAEGATVAEALSADHLEIWLFDPTVRRGEGCHGASGDPSCGGGIVAAEEFAADLATRHLLVFQRGALHAPDGKIPEVQGPDGLRWRPDGRVVASAWRDVAGGYQVEVRIPRADLPYVDDVEVTRMGIVVDLFDHDGGPGRQESIYSTSPNHGWWSLRGEPTELARVWRRDPLVEQVLKRGGPMIGPTTVWPDTLCLADQDSFRCVAQPERTSGDSPLPVVARLNHPNLTGDSWRSFVAQAGVVREIPGDVVWRGPLGERDCAVSVWDEPSGCFGAGCGDPRPKANVACVHEGIPEVLALPYALWPQAGDPVGAVCQRPSAAWARAKRGEGGDHHAVAATGWLLRFDRAAGTITAESPCPLRGRDGQTWTQVAQVGLLDGDLGVRER